jgi:hypothetical protein
MTTHDKTLRLLLRSVYLKGHQDANLKTSDLSWEDEILSKLEALMVMVDEKELKNFISNLSLDVTFKLDKNKTDKEIICLLNEQVSEGLAHAISTHFGKGE